jgi:alpha-ketoglutarate-dependent taurine dioxygenase
MRIKPAISDRFSVTPLHERFDWGVNVSGLDLAALGEAEVRQQLYDLWIQEDVIVFQGIHEMRDAEGDELLEYLAQHIGLGRKEPGVGEQADALRYLHV